ncbi:MAG TPA: hypothetical protein ENN78_00655 [Candidatus Omnitrophica bacterium]|nr:hypothetical protein [Candidatus Omnitrophota bacterium]
MRIIFFSFCLIILIGIILFVDLAGAYSGRVDSFLEKFRTVISNQAKIDSKLKEIDEALSQVKVRIERNIRP